MVMHQEQDDDLARLDRLRQQAQVASTAAASDTAGSLQVAAADRPE